MQNLAQIEASLWEAADNLRANSKLNASEYSMPVLGLIFLRHASNRFDTVKAEITPSSRGGRVRPITPEDFAGRSAIYVPEKAHYDYLLTLPDNADLGGAINTAMDLLSKQSRMLDGALPTGYTTFDRHLLRDLIRVFARDELRSASGDVFGRIYEYFLNKFAMSGAQEGGEFFTPPSLVRTIVNVIEPKHGTILDFACGSGGMFVQTGHFIKRQGENRAATIRFCGQEKSETNTRLARMNLAVHGLEGEIRQNNTFYDWWDELVGECDYIMCNPPFNVDGVSPTRIGGDPRLFTEPKVPGIRSSKDKKSESVTNANYLWIQYAYSHLRPTGRAGFVMSSAASDGGHGEKKIREQIIDTGAVDVMISIGTNFFYTRSLPSTLWFFDKGKPIDRREKVLMIDARSIHRVISRKLRDFSEEQLQNISAIVWLYRGEQERYLELVQQYLERLHQEAGSIDEAVFALYEPIKVLIQAIEQFYWDKKRELTATPQQQELIETQADEAPVVDELQLLRDVLEEEDRATRMLHRERQAMNEQLRAYLAWYAEQHSTEGSLTNEEQIACAEQFAPLVVTLKSLQKHISEGHKLTIRALDLAVKKLNAQKTDAWDSRVIRQWRDELDRRREAALDAIKTTLYFNQQIHWLQSRFPEAVFVDVPGLCRVVTRTDIHGADSSLTPGRYVGVAPAGMDDDEDEFAERMRQIHSELAELNGAAVELAGAIAASFEELAL